MKSIILVSLVVGAVVLVAAVSISQFPPVPHTVSGLEGSSSPQPTISPLLAISPQATATSFLQQVLHPTSPQVSPVIIESPVITTIVPTGNRTGCAITVSVQGGRFVPTKCEFQIVSPGSISQYDSEHHITPPPSFVLAMSDSTPGHIHTVSLLQFKDLKQGTYRFDRTTQVSDFKADLLDSENTHRSLQKGTVTLGQGNSTIPVRFDLTFDQGIHIAGSGTAAVVQYAAP